MSLALIDMDAEYRVRGVIVLDGDTPTFASNEEFWEPEIMALLDPLPEPTWDASLRKIDRDANWIVARRATIDWGGTAQELLERVQAGGITALA